MKKLIFLILITFSSKVLSAQKQLEIDSVFTIGFSINYQSCCQSYTDSVPAGRVWKIEGLSSVTFNTVTVYSTINGTRSTLHSGMQFPFWLGPGDKIKVYHASGTGDCKFIYSVIQFKLE